MSQCKQPPPTLRQLEVLGAIITHTKRHGFPPTIRHLGVVLGISSTNGINDHLVALERKGCLSRGEHQARAMVATRIGKRLWTAHAKAGAAP